MTRLPLYLCPMFLVQFGCFLHQPLFGWSPKNTVEYHPIPGRVEVELYDFGPSDDVYEDSDFRRRGRNYRGSSFVDMRRRKDASNGHCVAWTRAGEWLTYTLAVQTTGTYTVDVLLDPSETGGTFYLAIDGLNVSGPLATPTPEEMGSFQPVRIENVQLSAGQQKLKLVFATENGLKSIGDFDYIEFTLEPSQ